MAVIAEYVKWRDVNVEEHGGHEFIVMWSDHTWDEFKTPKCGYWIGDKTYKQVMALNKIVSSKMTKEEAIAYINERMKELEV